MSSFEAVFSKLFLLNTNVLDFYNNKATDGCWIYQLNKDEKVQFNKKLSIILGIKERETVLSKVLSETARENFLNLYQNRRESLNNFSQTLNVFHQSGTAILQHISYMVVVDESNEPYVLAGHCNLTSEQILINERDKSDNIIEGTHLGTWQWNVQTGETIFNERWAEIIGYTLEELSPVSIDTWKKFCHPQDLKKSEESLKLHFEGKKLIYEQEARMQHKEGHWVWVLDRGKVFTWTEDGKPEWMIGSHQEITDTKKEQIELEKANKLLKKSTQVATIGVWEVDLIKDTIYWSGMTKSIHEVPDSYEPELEKAIAFFPEGHNRDKITAYFNNAIEKDIPYDIELQILTYTNKLKWVRAIGLPECEEGKCVRIYGLFQDIDHTKQIQYKNEKLMEATQDQNNRLMNFAHIVSHNLRSHSNNFGMLVSMLNADLTEERREKIHEMLLSAASKLKDTISHLDEIVDINLTLSDNFTNLPLTKYVNATAESMNATIEDKNFNILLDFDREYFVFGVPAYVESLTLNFITNAIKYSDPEKEEQYVRISAERRQDEVLLSFSDNGRGIDLKRHGEKLFGMYKTFHRVEDSRGIGLFITKNQVEAMGGKITVESEVGVGTTFTVHLKSKKE